MKFKARSVQCSVPLEDSVTSWSFRASPANANILQPHYSLNKSDMTEINLLNLTRLPVFGWSSTPALCIFWGEPPTRSPTPYSRRAHTASSWWSILLFQSVWTVSASPKSALWAILEITTIKSCMHTFSSRLSKKRRFMLTDISGFCWLFNMKLYNAIK